VQGVENKREARARNGRNKSHAATHSGYVVLFCS
jgi:hypothetical protein